MLPTPCSHRTVLGLTGLCESCQADYDEDWSAYEEYGPHSRGEANWKRVQEEIAEDAARQRAEAGKRPPVDDSNIPF